MKQTLAIIFGGCASEYEVSLHSAAAVARAVDTQRYDKVLLGITRTGQWLYFAGDENDIENDSWHRHPSCVPALLSPSREDHGVWLLYPNKIEKRTLELAFPVLHGKNGEDGSVQGLLQLAGIPCVGCGTLASALCMDKDVAHRLAQQAGYPCPRFTVLMRQNVHDAAAILTETMSNIPYPWFVKPAAEGSSFGVSRVDNPAALEEALAHAFRYADKIVVEEGISGFEVGCAVAGGRQPIAGVPDAIALEAGFFDFHEKYNLETAQILVPAPLPEAELARVKETALGLYRLFGCSGFARVDLFYTPGGEIVFNEINTIPGMTQHSRFPGMMAAAGYPFAQMVQLLLDTAEEVEP